MSLEARLAALEAQVAELSRVIALYNTREETVRSGAYHEDSATEDGFAPGR